MRFVDSPNLHPDLCREVGEHAEKRYYHSTMTRLYDAAVEEYGLPEAVAHLTDIMCAAQPEVEALIQQRVGLGVIRDADQTRKSLAGNGFQCLVLYALASLQAGGLIPKHVVCTIRTQNHPRIGGGVIQVGPETIKPDADLLVYSARATDGPVCLFSLKTSLRERAGQTHRWKILMDIVTSADCHSIKDKYDLRYAGGTNFRMGLITTNFYNEITSPMQKGLLRFFEHVYLTKPGEWGPPVMSFSAVAEDIRRIYE